MRVEKIGRATLYCGDSRDLIPSLEGIDATITDPPYGIGFEYLSYKDTAGALTNAIAEIIVPALAISKRAAITPGNTNLAKYPEPKWYGCWTWDTTTARGKWGWSKWQPILFYGDDPANGFENFNGQSRADRIHFSGGQAKIDGAAGDIHTCPKPLKFMERLVARSSVEGETVFDPFLGSGTTGVAAVQMNRDFIGCEIEPAYFDISCRRIEQAQRQGNLFDAA